MKKFLALLFVAIIFLGGCGRQPAPEPEVKKELTLVDYIKALPNAYFSYYFPVGTTNPAVREKAIAVKDLEHEYAEFEVKDTVSGTVHWAIKGLTANDGSKLLVVSDILQTDVVSQHLYILKKNNEKGWNDETASYFGSVMKEVQKINVEKLVRAHYSDKEENKKLKNGRFIFSATSTDIIGGIGPALTEGGVEDVWDIEFPVYIIAWNGEKFLLKTDASNSGTTTSTNATTNTAL